MRNIRFGQCRIIHSQPLECGRGVDIVLFGTRLIASGGFTTGPMEGGGGGGGRFRSELWQPSTTPGSGPFLYITCSGW